MKRIFLIGVTAIFIVLGGCDSSSSKSVMSRDEFTRAVQGRTPDQVIAAVGRPDRTSTGGEGGLTQYWYYDDAAKDPITGKVGKVQVVVEDGKVRTINY